MRELGVVCRLDSVDGVLIEGASNRQADPSAVVVEFLAGIYTILRALTWWCNSLLQAHVAEKGKGPTSKKTTF